MIANSAEGDRERRLEAGTGDSLPDPIDQQELHEAVERFPASRQRTTQSGDRAECKSEQDDDRDAAAPIVAWDEAAERIPGGLQAVVELARLMQEECRSAMQAIREGLDGGRTDVVRRGAHTLKGSAGIFAAKPVVEAALRLETMGREGRLDGAAAAFEELSRRVEEFVEELNHVPTIQER